MSNYVLIPCNFDDFDFDMFKQEFEKTGRIMWQITGTPEQVKKTGEYRIRKDAGLPMLMKLGTIVYFYMCNIPTQSGENKSRIVLRGVVVEEPSVKNYGEIYTISKDDVTNDHDYDEKIIGFAIGDLRTLNKDDLENDRCFSNDVLETIYKQRYPQGKRIPSTYSNINTLNKDLIRDLEYSFKKNYEKNDFDLLIKHFKKECFFCNKIGKKSDHKTFKRRNGTDYFEGHHFIQQNAKYKLPLLNDLINSDENMIWLCSNCHNELHYGRTKRIKEKINILWEDEKIKRMLIEKNFFEIIQANNDNDAKIWIEKMYKSNDGNEKDNIRG